MCCCRGGVSSCGGKGGFHLFGFLPWGGGVAVGFSLGMLFVVVGWWYVVCCFYLGFDIYYFNE